MGYTSQQFLLFDGSSAANWKNWGNAISQALLSSGWVQQNDTGQVVWTVSSVPISDVAVSGSNATYTYDATTATGPVLRIGMSMTITGFTNGSNNVTATITAKGGSGASSTFTVVKASQANETHAATGVTTLTAVPSAGTFVNELWAPADSLQTGSSVFYLKMEYSIGSGSPAGPRVRFSLGTGTNGSGTLTGLLTGTVETGGTNDTGAGSITTYDCYFSGDTNRFHMLLFRSRNSGQWPIMLSIERTKNTDGTDSSEGVVLCTMSLTNVNIVTQFALIFGVSATLTTGSRSTWTTILPSLTAGATGVFNGSVTVFPVFPPPYGKIGNPLTGVCYVENTDVAEGAVFTTTQYGATRTYLATGNLVANGVYSLGYKTCMRYD